MYSKLALTQAEKFEIAFNALIDPAREEDGRVENSVLGFFEETVKDYAIDVEVQCPESYDSTLIYTFRDGSRLSISNPDQCTYASYAHVVD